ncbi:HNH endonuclease [Planococcus shixiaomingii]|uniref:HNH endonuclease n=1 Tax=Planococcus shixiaomingii TaxID=3058393 RepID=UPI00261FA5EE|nr:HNH endonuclease [Planococcus sp. N022]WKA55513.1 hypothetical protein QWY21_03780 [Planococcus sp. N022]
MIKLIRNPKPTQLTDQTVADLVSEYKLNGSNVWSQTYIKLALLELSKEKCCYCECNIKEESKYMEVEHFLPKKYYPDLVVDWDNLLPSCKRCNLNKGEHDPNIEYIINPCIDDPKVHIAMKNYRLKSKDQTGRNTIDVLYLNDTERLVQSRFMIGNNIHESLEKISDNLSEYYQGISTSTRRKNMVINGLKSLLRQGLPQKDYAATVATVIINDDIFYWCKNILIELDFWDDEFSCLENSLLENCLELV